MSINQSLEIIVEERVGSPGAWTVEAIGSDGEIYQAIFCGPEAETRALEYAAVKYQTQYLTSQMTSRTHD